MRIKILCQGWVQTYSHDVIKVKFLYFFALKSVFCHRITFGCFF